MYLSPSQSPSLPNISLSDKKIASASSPKEERKAVIADRIRKRAELDEYNMVTSDSDSIPSSNGGASQRKRFPSEMNGQIDEKRRKFLERNRAAAQRCREKRKQWINNLQKEKLVIQEENNKLHVSRCDLVNIVCSHSLLRSPKLQSPKLGRKVNIILKYTIPTSICSRYIPVYKDSSLQMQAHNLRQEVMNLKTILLQHKECSVTKASKEGKLDQTLLPPPIVCKFQYCSAIVS